MKYILCIPSPAKAKLNSLIIKPIFIRKEKHNQTPTIKIGCAKYSAPEIFMYLSQHEEFASHCSGSGGPSLQNHPRQSRAGYKWAYWEQLVSEVIKLACVPEDGVHVLHHGVEGGVVGHDGPVLHQATAETIEELPLLFTQLQILRRADEPAHLPDLDIGINLHYIWPIIKLN